MKAKLPLLALCLAAVIPTSVACSTQTEEADEPLAEAALNEDNCIRENAIESDGYTELLEADASLVTRKRLSSTGTLEADPEKVARPTSEQLARSMNKIAAHKARIRAQVPESARRRELYSPSTRGQKPEPYCLFHAAGKAVYGTVVLFHGFNDRPHQQAKLASYLFHSGFNVYNVFLAHQYMVPGTEFWPKTVYKPEVLATVQGKMSAPANQAVLAPIMPRLSAGAPTPEDLAVLDSVLKPELSMGMLQEAWADPAGPAFQKLFASHQASTGQSLDESARQSDYLDYVREAQARIAEVTDLPGAVFVSGLSVGGTTALAAAAADGGKRVRGVMSHAPWLSPIDPAARTQLVFAAPLDENIRAVGGSYPMQWESHKINFSPASVAANLALAAWTTRAENLRTLAAIPTAIIMTDAEDSADNTSTDKVHAALSQDPRVAGLHVSAHYPKELKVGHALTDPENYPQEAKTNLRFRALYQESFRFYTQGRIDKDNLMLTGQDPALPKVACKTPDYPHRCQGL